eukprot:752703-Alexandrium_andersonii.AAC.1
MSPSTARDKGSFVGSGGVRNVVCSARHGRWRRRRLEGTGCARRASASRSVARIADMRGETKN